MIPNALTIASQKLKTPMHSLRRFEGMEKHEIISYLMCSHLQYKITLIPQIEQSFLGLLKLLPNEPSLAVLFNLFVKFQISLELHMKIEEQTIYKDVLNLSAPKKDDLEHIHEEPFLTEIILSLNRQSYSSNPFCQVLIGQLINFDLELQEHTWIEENLI